MVLPLGRGVPGEIVIMAWSTRRLLRRTGWLCVGLMAGLTGAIVTVSSLSGRGRISLADGIAVFAVVVVGWIVTCVVLGRRWWRWSKADRQTPADRRVLVAYGSRQGGTAALAGSIADNLTAAAIPAEARAVRDVAHLDAYGAVVLGGAVYHGRWHPDARRFVRRHARALQIRPVWVFASGPLTDLAAPHERAPVAMVAAAAARIGARDVATFDGYLPREPSGSVAGRMVARGCAGDLRDQDQIRAWALRIAQELERPHDGEADAAWARSGSR